MSSGLGRADRAVLDTANMQHVALCLRRLKQNRQQRRWLGPRNRYAVDPVGTIESEIKGGSLARPRQLAEYVAISSPLHLWDGWTYLGLALLSQCRGSIENVRHLAYYAELRAAMALLATHGIGIFKDHHFVIDSGGRVRDLKRRPTHDAAWKYLDHFAERADTISLVGDAVVVGGANVRDWLEHLPGVSGWRPVGSAFLKAMGLDLARMTDDRMARNEASYRPTGVLSIHSLDAALDLDFVIETVRLLEPSGVGGGFEMLDQFMLRSLLEEASRAARGDSSTRPISKAIIDSAVDTLIGPSRGSSSMKDFLARKTVSDDPMALRAAVAAGSPLGHEYHLEMVGRACILLRIATATVGKLLRYANLRLDDVRFWWVPVGQSQGFWNQEPIDLDALTLWQEIEIGLSELEQVRTQGFQSRVDLLKGAEAGLMAATNVAALALVGAD